MSENIKAHIFKYKLDDGTWVDIPLLAGDVYTAYVTYCTSNNIEPVDQITYYQTLGSLKTLVKQLAVNSENIKAVADALAEGVLPPSKGGLGVSIGDGCDYATLQDALVKKAGVALADTTSGLIESVDKRLDRAVAAFASGTKDPNDIELSEDVIYYFQYKEG